MPVLQATEKILDDQADLVLRTRFDGLIGVGIHGLHRPPGMSELRGEAALVQLGRDYRSFCQGKPIRRTKAFREVLAAFQRVASRVIALDPNTVLANRYDSSYDRTMRADGYGQEGCDQFLMIHRIYLPYTPGGYREVQLLLEVDGEHLHSRIYTWLQYFNGDVAGKEADQPYNDARNEAAQAALDAYIDAALLDPALVKAAEHPPVREDLPNAWTTLDDFGLAVLLNNHRNLTAHGMDDPRRPGFDESRSTMSKPETLNLINHCIAFLSAFTPAKAATWGADWLAGHAAAWGMGRAAIQYNGALIAAALHLGLTTGPDYRYSISLGLSRKEVEWMHAQGPGAAAVGASRRPRDWDTFLGRRHLFA